MHGDISRRTFSERHAYRAVVLQQGRVVLDADFNEQADLVAHHDEARTADIVGRVGGALPADPAAPGPFAIRAADGTVPAGVPWSSLVVTPGRYYVDGVLTESFAPASGLGWPLTAQPHVRALPGVTVDGLGVPTGAATRYALYLEASDHGVTADEEARLRESALGGPDTSLRRQTTWQVRWAPLGAEVCSDLGAGWLVRTPRPMIAGLQAAPADADPCSITASGGYQRLENQLYRVQIHDGSDAADGPTYLWSRENGSVVAQPTDIGPSTEAGATARIALDREGRDAELDFAVGNLVEVTSSDYQLQRVPGHLARIVARTGLDLDVAWLGTAPASRAALGLAPLVRRWEGGPVRLPITSTLLEDGITVRFPNGGTARTGDYWLIPARAVRLAYGLTQTRGTLEWPPPGALGDAVPPMGPPAHIAPLGIVVRSGSGSSATWTLEHDCRRLFPALTALTTLDMAGGDGQESLPGAWLDQPLRVVVRNGASPVAGVRVRFTASNGGALAVAPAASGPAVLPLDTGPDGVAAVRWRLNPAGPTTQVLTAQRLNDKGAVVDVAVTFTARLSLATEVDFKPDPACAVFNGVTTVDGALRGLAGRPELRLQGGDGQLLQLGRAVLPHPIRVIVDSPCGPVAGVPVGALASGGAFVREVVDGEPVPTDLSGGATGSADGTTGPDGAALFWWQPNKADTDVLELRLPGDDPHHPIVVSAQRERPPVPTGYEGAHIQRVTFGDHKEFFNDDTVDVEQLMTGVIFAIDDELEEALAGKPIARVELDLPWPIETDGSAWAAQPVGTRTVILDGTVSIQQGLLVVWTPSDMAAHEWLAPGSGWLWKREEAYRVEEGILGRAVLEGWATLTRRGFAVNTHAPTFLDGDRVRYKLPTDDATAGGTFTQWFRLRPPPRIPRLQIPPVMGISVQNALRQLREIGFTNIVGNPPGLVQTNARVVAQHPDPGTVVPADTRITLGLGIVI